MSEPENTTRRRPPTIDLTAKEVDADGPAAAQADGTGEVPGESAVGEGAGAEPRRLPVSGSWAPYAFGAIAGAVVMLSILAAFWAANLLPLRGEAPAALAPADHSADAISARLDKIEAALATQKPDEALAAHQAGQVSARLDKIEATLAAQKPDDALVARIAAAEGAAKSLDASIAALNRRVDETAVAARTALAHADAAAAAADAAKGAAQSAVPRQDFDAMAGRVATLEAVAGRVAALEGAMKALSDEMAHRPANADDGAARMTVAAEALRATVERGAPYTAELAAVKTFGVAETELAPLVPFAATGLPSASALARELTELTPALARPLGAPMAEGTFLGRLQANAEKLVRVRPIDAPGGEDPAGAVAQINAAAARGDFAAAIAGIVRLPEGTRALAENWMKKATAREAALAAARRIAADALAALGRPVSQ